MLDYILHKLGITFITVAFIFIFIITIHKKKALIPFWFYLLYGIGGVMIFIVMLGQRIPFVYYNELIGFIIAFILAVHSFMYYKR